MGITKTELKELIKEAINEALANRKINESSPSDEQNKKVKNLMDVAQEVGIKLTLRSDGDYVFLDYKPNDGVIRISNDGFTEMCAKHFGGSESDYIDIDDFDDYDIKTSLAKIK